MRLLAISDLHLAHQRNRQALLEIPPHLDDDLIVAGDIGESEEQLHFALETLGQRFRRLLWVPGNHDLWTVGKDPLKLRGEAKYRRLVDICRQHGTLTPEDPYLRWPADGVSPDHLLAPLFVLYDYSFRPDSLSFEEALPWAAAQGIVCSDEYLLHPQPYTSRQEWCAARVTYTEQRLSEAAALDMPLVLINHFPLRRDHLRLRRIPRFSLWCGTRKTEDWHRRFNASVVVYGHQHVKGTILQDGVRFEEVSLGYPRDWDQNRGIAPYFRQILPHP